MSTTGRNGQENELTCPAHVKPELDDTDGAKRYLQRMKSVEDFHLWQGTLDENSLDLHLRRCCVALARRTTSNRNNSIVGRCTRRIRHKIEQRQFCRCTILIYGINWRVDILRDVRDLGLVLRPQYFGHDKGGVVDRAHGPLGTVFGLVTWRRGEKIVIRILTTNMEQRRCKVIKCHRHPPIEGPQGCAERIGYPWKTGA